MWSALGDRRRRHQLYLVLAVLSFAFAIVTQALLGRFSFARSDARGYYSYVASWVIDRDGEVENQLARDDAVEGGYYVRTPIGRILNQYPIGVSVTVLPVFVASHAISTAMYAATGSSAFAPDGYSVVYQVLSVALVALLAALTMRYVDEIATEYLGIDGRAVAIAIALYWFGSPYFYYVARQPLFSHAIGTFWVVALVLASERARRAWREERPAGTAVAAFALSCGMALITRPTNAVLFPFGLVLIRDAIVRHRARDLAWLPLVLLPALPQMAQWKVMSGSYIFLSYEKPGFLWGHPALWQTLFSSNHGLFFWSPLLLLSVVGLASRQALRPLTTRLLVFSFVALWYVNSAWWVWNFGGSFGGRAFLDLSLLPIVGLALLLERRWRAGARPFRVTMLACGACVAYSGLLMMAFMAKRIPIDGPILPWL